jgi:hypothetical protein
MLIFLINPDMDWEQDKVDNLEETTTMTNTKEKGMDKETIVILVDTKNQTEKISIAGILNLKKNYKDLWIELRRDTQNTQVINEFWNIVMRI